MENKKLNNFSSSSKSITCCYNCNKREIGCHSTCETYIKAKEKYEAEKAAYNESRKIDKMHQEFVSYNVNRLRKKYGKS